MIDTRHTWIEISRSAFAHNITQLKSLLKSDARLGVVVKSNAYGHGIQEIGALCQNNDDVSWLFTATLSEAALLRESGITKPILVLSYSDIDPYVALKYDIALTVTDIQTLRTLNAIGEKHNKKYIVHAKWDTGMFPFAFTLDEIDLFVDTLTQCPYIYLEGILSHLACAASEHQSINQEQQERFTTIIKKIHAHYGSIPYIHLTNSAGLAFLAPDYINLVRIGFAAYGWHSSRCHKDKTHALNTSFSLQPVATWKTKIIAIKEIPAHTPLGYDQAFCTTQKTRIALLPIGYFDGYDRRLSNKASVLIHAQYAPVLGLISMNAIMVDITHIPNVAIGDEVTLVGSESMVTPAHLAGITGTQNGREFLCRINSQISRIVVP